MSTIKTVSMQSPKQNNKRTVLHQKVHQLWYEARYPVVRWSLKPLSFLYFMIAVVRRSLFLKGVLTRGGADVPVIVVGNITAGGTGKTPVVIWLVSYLQRLGWKPGVVSRGYGRQGQDRYYDVTADSAAYTCGDEPVLIARRCGCPVVVSRDRVCGAQRLADVHECDIVVCDDGLQHYRLQRDVEIAVIDGARHLGNGDCIPGGPLREPSSRLADVDMVLVNGGEEGDGRFGMRLQGECLKLLCSDDAQAPSGDLQNWRGKRVHAVAAIGHPQRFFKTLEQAGLDVVPHVFPDHHLFKKDDFHFEEDLDIVMTEKDAVKCQALVIPKAWYLPVEMHVSDQFELALTHLLQRFKPRKAEG